MELLAVRNLTKSFGGLKALNDVSFGVEEGQLVGIVGPNGSGKSTCFNLITGFLTPTSGTVLFKGSSVAGLRPYEIARLHIVRTFQQTALFRQISVEENILLGLHMKFGEGILSHLIGSFFMTRQYLSKERSAAERVDEVIERLELTPKRRELAGNLSGPDQRRLQIAIALVSDPEVLLLDEPVAGMRSDEVDKIADILSQLHAMGHTILLVEHNMRFVMSMCQRIIVLNQGTKIAEGKAQEILANPEVKRVYLGDDGN